MTGVVDWENAHAAGLPDVDLMHWWLATRPVELGAAVRQALADPSAVRRGLAELSISLPNPQIALEHVVLLTWLGHVTAGMDRTSADHLGRVWLARNVKPILQLLAGPEPVGPEPVGPRVERDLVTAPAAGTGGSLPSGARFGSESVVVTDVLPAAAPRPDTLVRDRPADGPRAEVPRDAGAPLLAAVRSQGWWAAVPLLAALLWTLGFVGADPRAMGSFGLVSLFTGATVGALLLLVGGFLGSLYRNKREWVLGLYLVTYIALIHGTPAVLYGTLRYSWAYKHVGIVDYILRTGTVDPTIGVGEIYHNWPGFFAASALLTSLAGSPDALRIATWAPVVFNLMNLVVLRYVYRGLTRNKRLIWLALFFFFIINWVGQDYFSPQAMAYVLYLGLHRAADPPGHAEGAPADPVPAGRRRGRRQPPDHPDDAAAGRHRPGRAAADAPAGTCRCSAACSSRPGRFTAARSYTLPNIMELVVGLGQPVANANETLEKTATIAAGSQHGGDLGRSRGGDPGHRDGPARRLAELAGPRAAGHRDLADGAARDAGADDRLRRRGAVPGLPVRRAVHRLPGGGRLPAPGRPRVPVAEPGRHRPADGRAAARLPAQLLRQGAAELLHPGRGRRGRPGSQDNARPGSLLVEGSRNYPTQFKNYEKFTYVPIDREPEGSWRELLADPVDKLDDWLEDPRYTDAYILITRSQKIAVDTQGSMPIGSLEAVEIALRQSPQFRVAYDSGDAVVFELVDPEGR